MAKTTQYGSEMTRENTELHQKMLEQAYALAQKAAEMDEVPVGAVVYDEDGKIWGEGHNLTITNADPSAHAEIMALREAGKNRGTPNLTGLMLAVSLEPCAMCAQAMAWARIKEVHFSATDPKSGGVLQGASVFTHKTCHHKPAVFHGYLADENKALLQTFFKAKR